MPRYPFHVTADPMCVGAPQVPSDLPAIAFGTPRQREVAERIRAEYVSGVNYAIMWWLGYTDDGETSARRALGDLMPIDVAREIADTVTAFACGRGLDANVWLDHAKRRPDLEGRRAVARLSRSIRELASL